MTHQNLPLHVDGAWRRDGLPTRPVHNPASGEPIGELPLADPAVLTRAVDAARGYRRWRAVSAYQHTPVGVGSRREPPVFLAAGDVVEVEIDGVGVLRNPVADE